MAAAADTAIALTNSLSGNDNHMKHILIIDDDDNVRAAFMEALACPDYHVYEAKSGLAGLESVMAQRPDLVFLDLKMPGMNGAETLARLREI